MTQELLVFSTFCGVAVAVMAMFLPAIVELWKPKDAGPRLISENLIPSLSKKNCLMISAVPPRIADIEGEADISITLGKLLKFLPNAESFTVE